MSDFDADLIIAGAGTGKTLTLAHRVAHLVLAGAAPERLLLLIHGFGANQFHLAGGLIDLARVVAGGAAHAGVGVDVSALVTSLGIASLAMIPAILLYARYFLRKLKHISYL